MIIYEITATVNSQFALDFEKYMCEQHIPDLLATGYFLGAEMAMFSQGRYRIRYQASDKKSLDIYLNTQAEKLREDFLKHFPKGVELSREVLGVLQTWEYGGDEV